MKKLNYKVKLHFSILYIILIISIVNNIILENDIVLKDKMQIIKSMNKNIEVENLNKTIEELNTSHTQYSNYIKTSKMNLSTAITNAGVSTSPEDNFETMINNISNILSNKTNDATVTEEEVLIGKTAYTKGNKITGTMANNGEIIETINAGDSYTIPKGYHNGNGKITANSLESQTQATATEDNISEGKTAWVNGNLITGNGKESSALFDKIEINYKGSGGGNYNVFVSITGTATLTLNSDGTWTKSGDWGRSTVGGGNTVSGYSGYLASAKITSVKFYKNDTLIATY